METAHEGISRWRAAAEEEAAAERAAKEAEKKVDVITFVVCGILFVLGCYAVTYVLNLWPKL